MGAGAETVSKREAEEAIRHVENGFEDFLETMPQPAVMHSDGRFVLVNRAFVELLGYSSSKELLGRSVLDVVGPADRAYVAERLALPSQERAAG
jgi:PAS domain S-box-containing protein